MSTVLYCIGSFDLRIVSVCSKGDQSPSCLRYIYPPRAFDVYAPLVSDMSLLLTSGPNVGGGHTSNSGVDPQLLQQPLVVRQAADAPNGSGWLWEADSAQMKTPFAFWPNRSSSPAAPARAGYLLRLSHLQLDWEHVSPPISRAPDSVLYPTNELLRAPLGESAPPPRQPAFLPSAPDDMTLGVCSLNLKLMILYILYCT